MGTEGGLDRKGSLPSSSPISGPVLCHHPQGSGSNREASSVPSPAPHTVSTQHNEWMKGKVNKPQRQVWGTHGDTQAQGNDLPTLLLAQRLRNPTHTVSRYSFEMEKSPPPGSWHRSTHPIPRDVANHTGCQFSSFPARPRGLPGIGCSWPGRRP